MLARVIVIATCPSVRLSVRPSVRHAPVLCQNEESYWLSMVLRQRQHNIGYTADGFYRSDDLTNSVKALKEGG